MRIGDYLLRRLGEMGVSHIFGLPGDYNLELMQQLDEDPRLQWIATGNELNAGYAADGYARLKGLGALIVTHGVGSLSAVNGVAGAYAEHVPLVWISGATPLRARDQGKLLHHTFTSPASDDNFFRMACEVTAAQARLRPADADAEIDRVIMACWRSKRPVYIELPSDIAYLDIPAPTGPLTRAMGSSDAERVATCADHVAARLRSAKRPAFLLDVDAERFGIGGDVLAIADRADALVATMSSARTACDPGAPRYVGVYGGTHSPEPVRSTIEESDCLVTIGHLRVDSTTGFFADMLPADAISLRTDSADVDGENFQGLELRRLLSAIFDRLPMASAAPPARAMPQRPPLPADGSLTQAGLWPTIEAALRPGDVIVADNGTATAGSGTMTLPAGATYVSQAIWGSIGYTLPSLLGTAIAAPERRQLLFIGDGAFQLTAQELSTLLRQRVKATIFLLNNRGYTIERTILGASASFNDVSNWDYAALPGVFDPSGTAHATKVATVAELDAALRVDHDGLVFVEVILDPMDAPVGLIRGGHASADLDYGTRGPQRAAGAQISLPSS